MQVDYTLVIKMITLLSAFLFLWTFVLVVYRIWKASNGLRTFYYAFLPYVVHGVVYGVITQVWRWTGLSGDYALFINIWSATLRLHMIITMLVFIYVYKPSYHEWYDKIVKKVELLNGATD